MWYCIPLITNKVEAGVFLKFYNIQCYIVRQCLKRKTVHSNNNLETFHLETGSQYLVQTRSFCLSFLSAELPCLGRYFFTYVIQNSLL